VYQSSQSLSLLLVKGADLFVHRHGGQGVLRPRGPRSGPGYVVPVRHHLTDPIRPSRRHIVTSPLMTYTRCLRCAGVPRQPTRGSELSLSIPSWHAILSDPGEFEHRLCPILRCRHSLRQDLNSSALPLIPQSVSRGARISGLLRFNIVTACQFACPPMTDQTKVFPASEGFYFQAFDGLVTLSTAGYNYDSDWTPLSAGLSPAGIAASFAAPDPSVQFFRTGLFSVTRFRNQTQKFKFSLS